MKKGFALPLLILGLLGLSVFYIATFSSVYPNTKTQNTAQNIPKYPDISSWEIVNNKVPCLFNFGNCQTPASKIRFVSEDPWAVIYVTYRNNMEGYGWNTNSRVVTSIPTSIVFENEEDCQAELSEDTSIFTRKEDRTNHFYIFSVVCKS